MQITPFSFENHSVRIVTDESGDPWFVAADVLEVLELDRKALERLDSDEKGVNSIHTLGGIQEMTTINEPGMYALVLGSRKPEAKRFKRWITHEVLPSIRKTGRYETAPASKPQNPQVDLTMAAIAMARDIVASVPGVKLAMLESATLDCIKLNTGVDVEPLRKMLPAVEGRVCNLNATAVGKAVGLGAVKTNQRLADLGLQERGGSGQWELTESGRQYGEAIPYTNRGHSGYQILWSEDVVSVVQGRL